MTKKNINIGYQNRDIPVSKLPIELQDYKIIGDEKTFEETEMGLEEMILECEKKYKSYVKEVYGVNISEGLNFKISNEIIDKEDFEYIQIKYKLSNQQFEQFLESRKLIGEGGYKPLSHSIIIKSDGQINGKFKVIVIIHELDHYFTGKKINDNEYRSGFERYLIDDNGLVRNFGKYFNEGGTQSKAIEVTKKTKSSISHREENIYKGNQELYKFILNYIAIKKGKKEKEIEKEIRIMLYSKNYQELDLYMEGCLGTYYQKILEIGNREYEYYEETLVNDILFGTNTSYNFLSYWITKSNEESNKIIIEMQKELLT